MIVRQPDKHEMKKEKRALLYFRPFREFMLWYFPLPTPCSS